MNKNDKSIFSSLDIKNPNDAFTNAIKRGLKNPNDYMYMYSDKGRDYFKHIVTRNYISFKQNSIIEKFIKKILRK